MTRWRAFCAPAASRSAAPTTLALIDMIRRPAERAGMPLPDELVDALLADAGGQLGALPLVAFALSELWPEGIKEPDLTLAAYDGIGRLGGAIGRRAPPWTLTMRSSIACSRPWSRSAPTASRPGGLWIDRRFLEAEVQELIDILVSERFLRPGSDPSCSRWSWRTRHFSSAGRRSRAGSVSVARICEPAASWTMSWRAGWLLARVTRS